MSGCLTTLARNGLAERVFLHANQRLVYYTTQGGPRRVLVDQLRGKDRMFVVVERLWTETGGRPFSATALVRFAAGKVEPDPTADAWYTALQFWMKKGLLVQAEETGPFRRPHYAVAADWIPLTPEARAERMTDVYGRDANVSPEVERRPDGAHTAAPLVDAAFISRTRDVQALIEVATARRGEAESDPTRRDVLRTRPVRIKEIWDAGDLRPGLRPRSLTQLRDLLHGGAVRTPRRFAAYGVADGGGWYSVEPSEPGWHFIQHRHAMEEARRALLPYHFRQLQDSGLADPGHGLTLSPAMLKARAIAFVDTAQAHLCAVRRTRVAAPLLAEEEAAAMAWEGETEPMLAWIGQFMLPGVPVSTQPPLTAVALHHPHDLIARTRAISLLGDLHGVGRSPRRAWCRASRTSGCCSYPPRR